MASHLGDYDLSAVIYGKFTTFRPSSGAAFALGGTPVLAVYKDASTTQSSTGVTLTTDFDGVTGLNHYAIDTSADGTFYSAGSNFSVVITTGTVDSVSVVGSVVGSFSLRKNAVNAEVLDVLNVDTFAEPTGVPAATTTLVGKLGRLYAALINPVTVTASKKQFANASGTNQWEKDLADNGTSFTESAGNAP